MERSRKVAVCNDNDEVITQDGVENLQYVMITMKLEHSMGYKSCGM